MIFRASGAILHDHLASPVHMRTQSPVSYGVSLRAMPRNLLQCRRVSAVPSRPVGQQRVRIRGVREVDSGTRQARYTARLPAGQATGSIVPVSSGSWLCDQSRRSVSTQSWARHPGEPRPLRRAADRPESALRAGGSAAAAIRHAPGPQDLRVDRLREVPGPETSPGSSAESDAELADYVRAQAYTVHHPVSTCRMGNDAAAVVDPQLRVVGLDNLRVADASVFPVHHRRQHQCGGRHDRREGQRPDPRPPAAGAGVLRGL